MANARGKSIDNTHLSIDQAEARGFIHRDYIAHCMRWSHVVKQMYKRNRYKTARVFDIGCGVDVPLARTLYSQKLIPASYVGVEYNKPEKIDLSAFSATSRFPLNVYGGIDFANDDDVRLNVNNEVGEMIIKGDEHELPNIFTCFEVLEHIEPDHVRRVLNKVAFMMDVVKDENPLFFMSTPNYDPHVGAAANHVNEMRHQALNCLLEDLGFEISEEYGTFASQTDYKEQFFHDFPTDGPAIFSRLGNYYDSNYLATVLAPLYPSRARNCLRVLRYKGDAGRGRGDSSRRYAEPGPRPWTSSDSEALLYPDETSYDNIEAGDKPDHGS